MGVRWFVAFVLAFLVPALVGSRLTTGEADTVASLPGANLVGAFTGGVLAAGVAVLSYVTDAPKVGAGAVLLTPLAVWLGSAWCLETEFGRRPASTEPPPPQIES